MLGQGQYGAVYRGVYQGDTQVAVKTLKATASTKDFLLEAAIMKVLTFPCPSIVPLDTFPLCILKFRLVFRALLPSANLLVLSPFRAQPSGAATPAHCEPDGGVQRG